MKKRKFDAVCGADFARRSGGDEGGVIVGGGFGGFGGVPADLLQAMREDGFTVVQVGPDEYECTSKDGGEVMTIGTF